MSLNNPNIRAHFYSYMNTNIEIERRNGYNNIAGLSKLGIDVLLYDTYDKVFEPLVNEARPNEARPFVPYVT